MKCLVLLLSFVFIRFSSAQFNPLKDEKICGRPICTEQNKFKYLPEKRYTYEYSTTTETFSDDSGPNRSILSIKGEASLIFLSKCDGLLELSNFKLSNKKKLENAENEETEEETEESSETFTEVVSKNFLRFSFSDGVISEVCPDANEENWIINFKKGILSLINNNMRRFDLDYSGVEEDIQGKCLASYKLQKAKEAVLVIEKTKDFSTCEKGRSHLQCSVQSTPYYYKSKYESANLLKSSSTCQLSIDNHIYSNISCSETHLFQPFAKKATDAMTIVNQQLTFISESSEKIEPDDLPLITKRSSLLYDHKRTPTISTGSLKVARELIKTLCRLSTEEVQTEYADAFSTLIRTGRTLTYESLTSLLRHSNVICPNGRKFILEALPYLGNDASVEIIKDMALKNEIPDHTLRSWITTISFVPNPSSSMLKALHELLKEKISDSVIAFGVSTLVSSYCKRNADCLSREVIFEIIELYESHAIEFLEEKKKLSDQNSKDTEYQIFVALKCLGNIGLLSENFRVILDNLVQDSTAESRIRIAAIETYRKLPCQESRVLFEEIYQNLYEDSEVRIAAYLQIMRCPNYKTIQFIENILQIEQVNQVGSFVWSHLNNLHKSSVLSKLEIQGLLSDKDLKKKFSSDVRKFSRNFEGSIFFEEYNFGGNYESNIIFSPSSYIPRSLMLNMTVNLFGESINLFEVYGRIEGFERYVENLFGSKGPMSFDKVREKIPKLRWPRATNEYNTLTNEINDLGYKIKNNFDYPKISAGFKIFGNDIRYEHFNGEEEMQSTLNKFNLLDHLKQILSGKEINLSKSALFMDTSYVIPTSSGLPLSLNLLGTASLNLKLFGSIKMSNYMKGKEFDLLGSIRPNMAINLMGTMSVNGVYGVSGIKLKTNVYSSSSAEVSVKVQGNRFASIKIGLPQQTTEIFGVESELQILKNGKEKTVTTDEKRMVRQTSCSWPALDKAIGLKLCSHVNFANVTKKSNTSYFSLAGPAGVRISLHKSDPSIKTYSLEYSLKDTENGIEAAIVFDTPGSQVKRLISANFTKDSQSLNASLLMQSATGEIHAQGSYRNSKNLKYLQSSLDINHKKHFGLNLSLEDHESAHGHTYLPKLYLEVNSERVAELFGTFKSIKKKGILQCDIDLKFQTKRLTSKLFGYISQTDASFGTNLKLYYKFAQTQEQRVRLELYLANRSTRIITAILGNLQFETTAYPLFNFDIDLKFQRAAGRMETKLELKTNPPGEDSTQVEANRLTVLAMAIEKVRQDGIKFSTIFSVKKPSNDIDLRLDISYETRGPIVEVFCLVRYAKDKDIIVSLFLSHPRGTFEHLESRLNVTLPTFTRMILEVKLNEKLPKEYDVEISGTWFSGHSFSSVGVYQDKSSSRSSNHRLKMLIKSPNFSEIHADCHFYRDNTQIEVNLQADQNSNEYLLYFKHKAANKNLTLTQAKVKYQTKIYSISSSINLKEDKNILIELHLDEYRDVQFEMWIKNENSVKSTGLEIKWDANRDPNKKLSVLLDYSNPQMYDYSGNIVLSYPGRTLSGVFHFHLHGGEFSTFGRLAWGPNDALGASVFTVYKNTEKQLLVHVKSELITPFDDWKKTSINVGFNHGENLTNLNGSIYWQTTQHVSLTLHSHYLLADASSLELKFRGSLDSTLIEVPSMSAKLDHKHNKTKIDTVLNIMYELDKQINVKSIWQIVEDINMTNLTGSISLTTPFQDYKKGILLSKMSMTNDRHLRAVADLNLDHKKFTASVRGHLQKITNNMINFNITTPTEKYKEIQGQIGFSEEKKHLIALLQYPSGSTGVEIKLYVTSLTSFDVKFYVATPLEFLLEILLVAKLKTETADFRAGWNHMLVGFTGIWHYEHFKDFEHSYKIFTPIEDYEVNGVTAKLIFKEGLDTEFSAKIAQYQLGFKVFGQPKPKLFTELDIKVGDVYQPERKDHQISKDLEKVKLQQREFVNWSGLIEIDTLVYPTMRGTLDIDQFDNVFAILGNLKLPNGQATLEDLFTFEDVLSMNNHLHIKTPFEFFKTVNLEFELNIKPKEKYLLSFDFGYQNKSEWTKVGALGKYILQTHESDQFTHAINCHIHTPLVNFPQLDVKGILQNYFNTYRVNLEAATNKTNISSDVSILLTSILEVKGKLGVRSPVINIPSVYLFFKKNFTDIENNLEFLLNTSLNSTHKLLIDMICHYQNLMNFKTTVDLQTPFQHMDKSRIGVEIATKINNTEGGFYLELAPMHISTNMSLKDSILRSNLMVNFNENRHTAVLLCVLRKSSTLTKDARGHLTIDGIVYSVNGSVETSELGIPLKIDIEIEPRESGNPYFIQYLHNPELKEYMLMLKKQEQNIVTLKSRISQASPSEKNIFVQIDTLHQRYNTFKIEAETRFSSENNSIQLRAETPFTGLKKPIFDITLSKNSSGYRNLIAKFEVLEIKGKLESFWIFKFFKNMRIKIIGNIEQRNKVNDALFEAFYVVPSQSLTRSLDIGVLTMINNVWQTFANLSITNPNENKVDFSSYFKLPPPQFDVHKLKGGYSGDFEDGKLQYNLNYRTSHSKKNYGSRGSLCYGEVQSIIGKFDVDWGEKKVKNMLDLRENNNKLIFNYKLQSPYYTNEETLVANLTYKNVNSYHDVSFHTFSPSSREIASALVHFKSLKNMNGTVNVTSPFKGLNYTGSRFNFETSKKLYNRYLEVFWPKNKAFINSKCNTKKDISNNYTDGVIFIEVPLSRKHIIDVNYSYKELPLNRTGLATVKYNNSEILKANYKCISELRKNFDKDKINIELINKWLPLGLIFLRSFELKSDKMNSKNTFDFKRVEIYHLHNKTLNVTGDLKIHNTETGQNVVLTAFNLNRTVKFFTDYDIQDDIIQQNSKLELEPSVWVAYDLRIINKTKDENEEAKMIEINLSYPRRKFTGALEFNLTNSSFNSETWLQWENKTRNLEAAITWMRNYERNNHHSFELEFRHPSFEKNVTFFGEFESGGNKLADLQLNASYSLDSIRDLKVRGLLERNITENLLNYTYTISSKHLATNLLWDVIGDIFWKKKYYRTSHYAKYERTYLPLQTAETSATLDLNEKEIELKRKNIREFLYFWGKYAGNYPIYTSNFTALHGEELNYNGTFYLNFIEKLLKSVVNLTEDGSQCLKAYGSIPDARSAVFDIWKEYEDIWISDVAYFVRLNHSRLIVSKLQWRPELKKQIKEALKAAALTAYKETMESIDYWRHFVRAEIADTISDIFNDAKPFVNDFIEDLKELKVVEDDLKVLQAYLNKSYYANEFYVRDLVGIAAYAVDELSIKSHFESLPAFVREIWELMGESGKKIQRGIQLVIEKIKYYYKSCADFLNGLLQGDTAEHLSEALKKLIEKYDNFIKEMHVAFIRYMENLWDKTYTIILDNWHKTLAAIEPTFIKIAHYLETLVWNASTEFLDFLYLRKNELIESPYFSKFTHFTQDLDKFYRDITGNETVWKIIEYSQVGWNFVKEKYFELVPFSKELQNVTKEIVDEIKELGKLPSIQILLEKLDDLSKRIQWFLEYFDVENRFRQVVSQGYIKLTEITQTALQIESKYREAKTLFVFEPKDGIMLYEQKLPISWHAFNEAPKFEEIPEYKTFYEIRNYFVLSKTTFWNLYYNFKTLTDPKDWFPPFKGKDLRALLTDTIKSQAMLAGRNTFFITFDRVFYTYTGSKTYLLASDFLDRNFSIAISYTTEKEVKEPYEIIFATNSSVLHINIFSKKVRLENETSSLIINLPFEINGVNLYEESGIITLEKHLHYSLKCNTKFVVCLFEVSGWYFGKTSGLWGTMNNEPSDDLTSSYNQIINISDAQTFAESWSLSKNKSFNKNMNNSSPISEDVQNLCEILFSSKVSPFSACFTRVPVEPFSNICFKSHIEDEVCTIAIAYMDLCAIENLPLRIPDNCVKCDLVNGSSVKEGKFITFGKNSSSFNFSSDFVFIIEAKECNRDLRKNRNIDLLIELIDKELVEKNITENRYAVILFGGNGIYDKPRTVVSNGQIFTNSQMIVDHFNRIPVGNGNADIFGAIAFASKLLFRPGVSKTFILVPCSDCLEFNMKLHYGILHQVLLENDITLHILMNQDFELQKSRYSKTFFGIDRTLSYSRKDVRELEGDPDLRKKIKLPKQTLGFCIPLALESDGSLFNAKKLEGVKVQAAKRFATVFAKRIAKTGKPSACQMCECTADNTGISYMECFPCNYSTSTSDDYGFHEEDAFSIINPLGEGLYDSEE